MEVYVVEIVYNRNFDYFCQVQVSVGCFGLTLSKFWQNPPERWVELIVPMIVHGGLCSETVHGGL